MTGHGIITVCTALAALVASAAAGKIPAVRTIPHELDILVKAGHIQGADCCEEGVFLSHSRGIELVDWNGRLIRRVDAPSHLGDVAFADGKVYGAFVLRGKEAGDLPGMVRVWNAKLEPLGEKRFAEALDGITVLDGTVYVGVDRWGRSPHSVCCVKRLDLDLNDLGNVDVELGYGIHYGVQTMATDGKDLFFGNYGGTSRVSSDLKTASRISLACSEGFGLVPKSVSRRETPVFFTVKALGGNMQGWRKDPTNNPPRIEIRFHEYRDWKFADVTAIPVDDGFDMPPPACRGFESVRYAADGKGTDELVDFMRGRPGFDGMLVEYDQCPKMDQDGSLCVDLDALPPKGAGDRPGFFVNLYPRSPVCPKQFYTGKIGYDDAKYRAWREKHPGFRAFITGEWGNDAFQPYRKPERLLSPHTKRWGITQEQLEALLARHPKPKTREAFVNDMFRPHYDRVVDWCFSDPKRLLLFESHYCIGHLAAYWGAGELGIETTRSHMLWQVLMMFCRGAARQFARPWMWYIASYMGGSADGKYVNASLFAEDGFLKHHGPNFGITLSSMKRATYLSYLSGANYYMREAMFNTHFLRKDPPVRLSDEGRMYEKFHAFTKRHDRGTAYAPIALLVPANRGYTRLGGRAFGVCDYTHADFMLDAVMSTILDFPQNRRKADMDAHVERVMSNSRYGDFFDAITPDFADQSSFRRTIGDYKAAVLVGEYGRNPELAEILRGYVEKGGTLALTSAQTDTFPVDLARAMPAAHPSFRELRLGKGRVLVAKTPYLTPWYGDDPAGQEKALAETAIGEPAAYPEIAWLMDRLLADTVPIRVRTAEDGTCAVQYGLNRTANGWLVYLINNGGVRKAWNEAPTYDPKPQTVTVDLSRLRHTAVREICEGEAVTVRGNDVEVRVPSGDVRILEIR